MGPDDKRTRGARARYSLAGSDGSSIDSAMSPPSQ
jgi:hypothetical protein